MVIGAAYDAIGTVTDLLDVLKLLFDAESRACKAVIKYELKLSSLSIKLLLTGTNEFFLARFDRS